MVLIDVPTSVAEAFRLGQSSGAKMQWRCSSSANYLSVCLRWISSEGGRSRAGLNSRQRRRQRRLHELLQIGASDERRFSPSCLQQDDFDSSKRAPQNLRVNLSSGEHDLDLKDIPPAQVTTQGGSRPPTDTFAAKGSRATSLPVPTSCSIDLVGSSWPSSPPPQAHAAAETFQRSKESTAPYKVQRNHGHEITNLQQT